MEAWFLAPVGEGLKGADEAATVVLGKGGAYTVDRTITLHSMQFKSPNDQERTDKGGTPSMMLVTNATHDSQHCQASGRRRGW